jgi:hypothetical protein
MKNNLLTLCILVSAIGYAQPGKILSYQRISYNAGNLSISPDSVKGLGYANCFLGDLDKDGKKEIFCTSPNGLGLGYILSLHTNGTVYKSKVIGRNRGLPDNATPTWLTFGESCTSIGDLDKDGVTDLAIGNAGESGYGGDVILVFLNANGSIKSHKTIAQGMNGFNATLGNNDKFGSSLVSLGDIDNNRTIELVVGAYATNDGATEAGAIWVLSLDSTGTCTDYKKISHTANGGSALNINNNLNRFGMSSAKYKDINGDQIPEFFVGAPFARSPFGKSEGKFYCLSINSDKTLKSFKLFTDSTPNFGDTLLSPSYISRSIGNLGDIDGNGFDDIVTGTNLHGGGISRGHARVFLMEDSLKIKSSVTWDSLMNGAPAYQAGTHFGFGLAGLGDINNDGRLDAIVGLRNDNTNAVNYGALYILFLDGKQYQQAVNSFSYDMRLKLYPNPIGNHEDLMIELPAGFSGQDVLVSICSASGQCITTGTYRTNGHNIPMRTNGLAAGMYLLTLMQNNQYYHAKLFIE